MQDQEFFVDTVEATLVRNNQKEYKNQVVYEITGIPFYSKLVGKADLITVKEMDGEWWIDDVLRFTNNSTVQIKFIDVEYKTKVTDTLVKLGCELCYYREETSDFFLCAIHVPAKINFKKVYSHLQPFEEKGIIIWGTGKYYHDFEFPENKK